MSAHTVVAIAFLQNYAMDFGPECPTGRGATAERP